MKVIYWLVGLLVGVSLVLLILIYGASELGGEVVTLERSMPDGDTSNVRIWIVDDGDSALIEHGDAHSFWLQRIVDSPQLRLTRGNETAAYVAVANNDAHDLYHRLRREKYGWADQIVALFSGGADGCQGVPVRLRPAG